MPAVKARAGEPLGEFLAFTDTDALHALEVILRRRPSRVTIEQAFAETHRGAALIARITSDPALSQSEVRIIAHDGDVARSATTPAPRDTAAAEPVAPAATPVLDQRGTRRAPRVGLATPTDALLDGNAVTVVDLSTVGAQVLSPTIIRPNQRVRMVLSDEQGIIRLNASVAWASLEIAPKGGICYRAGIEFLDADAALVSAYAERHRA